MSTPTAGERRRAAHATERRQARGALCAYVEHQMRRRAVFSAQSEVLDISRLECPLLGKSGYSLGVAGTRPLSLGAP